MATSKPVAIRAALIELWQGASGLEGVSVVRVAPSDRITEALVVGACKSTRRFKALGNQPTPLDEEFSLTCQVEVFHASAKDYAAPEDRAYEILEAAEDAMRADPHLELGDPTSPLLRHYLIASTEDDFAPTDPGRTCAVRFVIQGVTRK